MARRFRFRVLAVTLFVLGCLALYVRHHASPRTTAQARGQAPARPVAGESEQPTDTKAEGASSTVSPTSPALRALFSYVPAPGNAAELEERNPAPAKEIHYVRIDPTLVSGKSSPFWQPAGEGIIALILPNGRALEIAIDHSEIVGVGRFTSSGRVVGLPASSRALFAYSSGVLQATVEDPTLGSFTLRYGDGEVSQFFQVDPSQLGSCAGAVDPRIDPAALAIKAAYIANKRQAAGASRDSGAVTANNDTASDPSPPPSAAEAIGPTNAEVHLMMVYTQDVLNGAGSAAAVESTCDLGVATVNSDFARSQITTRIKLVKIAQVSYNESLSAAANVQRDALDAVSNGKVAGVDAMRDEVGADLVNLVVFRSNPSADGLSQTAGIGYMLKYPSFVDATEAEFSPLYGFSVVRYSFVNASHVLSHELGHNFGCQHDRENASDGAGAYPYSYGYRFTGADGSVYHDIMSYALNSRDTLLPYFSNPDVIPTGSAGKAIGIAPGLPGESSTAKTIEQDAFEVSMYRQQKQTVGNKGTLINVATLAYVGDTDAQQLIGGFVINGSQPKSVLVRAVGPALAAQGVSEFLRNPSLVLNLVDGTGAHEFTRNDDWSVPLAGAASGSTIASAIAQVGAFALPAGSLDSAVLVNLPATNGPTSYTVNVSGANRTTGMALVEAYEVGPTTTRLLNLATRGYMDLAHSMIAGFVISGNAGETKRVLIRVRGPSLATFGLSGAADPIMTLFNSAQQPLVANDDFSNDGTIGDSTAEKAIIATGYAPTSRNEPCILVDLTPGSYTVIAKPFERLPAQPARPGVAIIEVFELN